MQNMCRLVKPGECQQIQNSAAAHEDDEHQASILLWDGYSGLFSVLIHTILSEANNTSILCMSKVTKHHCIIIHKVLSICIQKTPRSAQHTWFFFLSYYLQWPSIEKQTSCIAIRQWLKKQNSTPKDFVYILTIQRSHKDKEIELRLSWGIDHAIASPTVMPQAAHLDIFLK